MKLILKYSLDHLQAAVSYNNSKNPWIEKPLSCKEVEELLFDGLSDPEVLQLGVLFVHGICFIPEFSYPEEEEEYIIVNLHITVLPAFYSEFEIKEMIIHEVEEDIENVELH